MTRRCVGVLVLCIVSGTPLLAAGDITVTPLARDGQVVVSFDMTDAFTAEVSDAIQSGLPTTFSYDVELRRGWGMFDRTVASFAIRATIRFDNLTRRYQMSRAIDGRVEDARPTEDQATARQWLTHFEHLPLSATAVLEANGEYFVRVRARTRPRSTWFSWPWESAASGQAKFTFVQ